MVSTHNFPNRQEWLLPDGENEPRVLRFELRREVLDAREVGQIEPHHHRVLVARARDQLVARLLALRLIPTSEHHRGTLSEQAARGFQPDSRIGTRDDGDLAVHDAACVTIEVGEGNGS